MRALYRYSVAHPWRVLWIAVLVTLVVSPGALRLELRTDGHALQPPNALHPPRRFWSPTA